MTHTTNTQSPTAFDPTKPVQTRDGRKVRILCTDRLFEESIVALVESATSPSELIKTYYSDGAYFRGVTSCWDLVNIPEVTTQRAHVYRGATTGLWSDFPGVKKKDVAYSEYVGYIEWTFENGEPVSAKLVKDSQ